jgi:hypothetical protein
MVGREDSAYNEKQNFDEERVKTGELRREVGGEETW